MFFAEQREQNAKTTYSDAITFLYYNSFQDRKTIEDKKVTKIIDIHFSQGRKMDSIILKIIVLKDRTIIFRLRFWHAVRKNTTKNPPEKLFTNEKQLLDFEKGGVMRLSQGSECEELMFIFGALARKELLWRSNVVEIANFFQSVLMRPSRLKQELKRAKRLNSSI